MARLMARVAMFGLGFSLAPQPSLAQLAIQPLLDPVVLPDYDRGRNVGVAETPQPDYDPLGISAGDFRVFPSLTATTQVNSNVFFNDFDKHTDIAALIQPTVFATSDWSNALVQVYATDQIRRDARYAVLDRNTWATYVSGRLDMTDALTVTTLVQAGRFTENPYASVVDGVFAVLSQYDQVTASVKGAWTRGHLRVTARYEHAVQAYAPLRAAAAGTIDQAYRDNRNDRELVQAEYALSPGLAVYSQVSLDAVKYRYTGAMGLSDRNSTGAAVVGGVSLDWSGVARGALGIGYSRRDYTSGAFPDPGGLSVQAKIEVFPSAMTTVTGSAYRLLRDANSGASVAYYDSHVECDVDHALRRNVIVSARLYYGNQAFVEDPRRRTFYQASLVGKVKFDRRFNADINLGYGKSTTNGGLAGAPFGQFVGSVALQVGI